MVVIRRKMTPKGALITGIFLLALTVFFAVFTTYHIIKSGDRVDNCTEKIDAEVVDIIKKKETGRNGHIKYHPVVEYKVGKKKYEHTIEVGDLNPDDHKIGEMIEILYDPDDPEKACIEAEVRKDKRFGWMMIAYTVLALGAAIYYLHKSKKLKQAQAQSQIVQAGGYGPGLDEMNR